MVPGISSFGNARIREIGARGRVFRLRMPHGRAMNPFLSHTPVMPLEKITSVTGRGAYVPGSDIDTDRIIPARFSKRVTFDVLGEYLFYDGHH